MHFGRCNAAAQLLPRHDRKLCSDADRRLFRQAHTIHYPLCAGIAADTLSYKSAVLRFPEAAAYRGIHMLYGDDDADRVVAGCGAYFCNNRAGDISNARSF